MSDSGNNQNRGDGSINIAGGIQNYGQQYVGQNIHVAPHRPHHGYIDIKAERTKAKKLHITRNQLFTVGGALGFIGFLGSIASIYSVMGFPPLGGWGLFMFICGAFLFLIALHFERNVELRVPVLGSLEVDREGGLYLTDTIGVCPVCGGKMRLYPGRKHETSPVFVCERDSGLHRFHFSMSTMPHVRDHHSTW